MINNLHGFKRFFFALLTELMQGFMVVVLLVLLIKNVVTIADISSIIATIAMGIPGVALAYLTGQSWTDNSNIIKPIQKNIPNIIKNGDTNGSNGVTKAN